MTAAATTTKTDLPYEVLALGDGPREAWRRVGRYPHLEAALTARVADVLAQLEANDGWLVFAEHLVIGPGPSGPASVFGYATEVGADPGSSRVPDPFDLEGTRRWLLAAHDLP